MQINVFFDRENKEKTVEVDENSSVKDLLGKMKINPVTVIVSRDNNILTEDEKINDRDKIKLISVISGG
ncbi:MAG: MoaD/ThiS family protein [Candidatus Woesearchaeota archaeon]|jgi:thiamine biosynthesis protein ThiS|nr:MoaD/ThiS family protein [Candidatus Woesearchaeota archaeon]